MRISRAQKMLVHHIQADTPAFLWGAPGVGKSDIVGQTADELFGSNAANMTKAIDFRAILRDPVDLRGLPDLSGGVTKWLSPDELPRVERDGPEGLFFLDEINAAPPSMQAACYGLVLDRKLGDYHLPGGWRVVAAGNRQTDRASAQSMPTALANRFAHIDVEPNAEDFSNWGAAKGISPIIRAFARFRTELLHQMPADRTTVAFPTPRSWVQAAKHVDAPDDMRLDLMSQNVGADAALEFEGFIRIYRSLPSIRSILLRPADADLVTESSSKYAVSAALSDTVNTEAEFTAARTYLKRLGSQEYDVMFGLQATKRDLALTHTDAYVDWSTEHKQVLLAA